jgi:membrane-associated phospholipid phosphatase
LTPRRRPEALALARWWRWLSIAALCVWVALDARAAGAQTAPAPAGAAAPAGATPASPELAGAPGASLPEPYKFQPGVICPLCEITPQFPAGRSGLHWHGHWQPAGTREYIAVPALALGVLAVQFIVKTPDRARWNTPILFDRPMRSLLRIDSARGRDRAALISDGLFVWEVLHPSVIDPLLVAWWKRESPFVAWQMVVIDAQAYALTLFLNNLAKKTFARARPWLETDDCAQNPNGESCGVGGGYLSFYSGHSAVTATGAGLLCAHHTQLSLYQNDLLDQGTCALAVLGTAATGALRIASDSHWASDVIIGHLLGYTSGYLLPTLLYYKEFRTSPHDHPNGPTYAALPLIGAGTLGLSLVGMF